MNDVSKHDEGLSRYGNFLAMLSNEWVDLQPF